MTPNDDPIPVERVREAAYPLYARWHAQWFHSDDIYVSTEELLEDFRKYSLHDHDQHLYQGHDHNMYVLHPSFGDEAGYWTLYVVADDNPDGTVIIEAMWQVFDTMPTPIYEREQAKDPKDLWYNDPSDKTRPLPFPPAPSE